MMLMMIVLITEAKEQTIKIYIQIYKHHHKNKHCSKE